MVKTALKNFFKNIIYVFVPMGILYLFVLVALFALLGAFVGSAGDMLTELSALVSSTVETSGISVTKFIEFAAEELQGKNIFETIQYILDTAWVTRTVQDFFSVLDESSSTFTGQFTEIVTEFSTGIKVAVGIAISWVTVGLTLSNFATRFVVRSKSARRGVKKWIVANTVIPIVQALLLVGTCFLAGIVQYYTLLVVVVLVVAFAYISLVSAWIVHGGGKVAYKELITGKNVLSELLSVIAVLAIVVAVFALFLILNPIVAVLVLIPLIVYAMNILSVNSESYVISLAEAKGEKGASGERKEAEKKD